MHAQVGFPTIDASSASPGPRSIRLYLADGTPQGLAIAEVVNWSGIILAAPRSRIAELLRRPEAARTGIYILAGPDPDRPGGMAVYIGETDNVANRLRIHLRSEDRDFFERVAIVVAKDALVTKSHARYIESQLIQIAAETGAVSLENTTLPKFRMLPEADKADMQYFIRQLRLVLPLLGFPLFRQPAARSSDQASPVFVMSAGGASAMARETDDGFMVLAGSTARKSGTDTFPSGYRALRDQLVEDGRLVEATTRGLYAFEEDTIFSSTSAAASVVAARSASGPREWAVKDTGQTYRDWRAARLDSIEDEMSAHEAPSLSDPQASTPPSADSALRASQTPADGR